MAVNANPLRKYWIDRMLRVAEPVLSAMAEKKLKQTMPVESKIDRTRFTHLEALGRTLTGLAPWLEQEHADPEEESQRSRFADLARRSIAAATDPDSPDYCQFSGRPFAQALVDAAFLAHAIVRAPCELWQKLEEQTKAHVIGALKETRTIRPPSCNWLLFSGMVEAALHVAGEDFDPMRIDYAVRQHEQWYMGDGMYGDGPDFHWDYYNSYVIQPMLIDIIRTVGHMYQATEGEYSLERLYGRIMARARRYAAIQERLISPSGTFPAIGRSIAYRTGAFQHLAQISLMRELPPELSPAQVRCALQAVIGRCLDHDNNYDPAGYLKIGLSGSQPGLGEHYISTGSLYLCTTVFLPLGLPVEDPFWQLPDEPWSAQRIWPMEEDMQADKALHEK